MAGFKLAWEGGELSYGRSAVVCYEKMEVGWGGGEWRGPAFVVLRQTGRDQPLIVFFLLRQRRYAKGGGAHAWRTRCELAGGLHSRHARVYSGLAQVLMKSCSA